MTRFGAAKLDLTATRLDTLRAQADRLAPWERDAVSGAFGVADAYLESVDRIGAARYRADREAEELRAAHAKAVDGFAAVDAAVEAAVAVERESATDAWDGARMARVREGRRLADVIDVTAMAQAEDAETVLGLVADADAFGVGDEARAAALRMVRPRAALEQRKGRLNGEWFAALCRLTEVRVAPTARHEVAGRVDARRATLKRFVRQVAAAIGVEAALVRVVAQPPVPDDEAGNPPKSRLTFGAYWEARKR